MQYESGEQELIISVTGKIQLEILTAVIKERFGLNVLFSPPTVIYKETIQKSGTGFDAYTMPKPCWAVVSTPHEEQARMRVPARSMCVSFLMVLN